jgi:hypothetical protein
VKVAVANTSKGLPWCDGFSTRHSAGRHIVVERAPKSSAAPAKGKPAQTPNNRKKSGRLTYARIIILPDVGNE